MAVTDAVFNVAVTYVYDDVTYVYDDVTYVYDDVTGGSDRRGVQRRDEQDPAGAPALQRSRES